jgi:hypothetical protein
MLKKIKTLKHVKDDQDDLSRSLSTAEISKAKGSKWV